jgi:hypothetical protein
MSHEIPTEEKHTYFHKSSAFISYILSLVFAWVKNLGVPHWNKKIGGDG